MEERSVLFETAVTAKEKGFPQNFLGMKEYPESGGDFTDKCFGMNVKAPSQSVLQTWLREIHKIRVFPEQKVAGDFGFVIYTLNTDLEWCTQKENVIHSHKMGRHPKKLAENHPNSTISSEKATEVKKLLSQGIMPTPISKQTGVSVGIVYNIKAGYSWKHLKIE